MTARSSNKKSPQKTPQRETPPHRGKRARAPVTRERALRVAVALADAHGLAELTMRRLADELHIEAMSLYHHVPNKDAILDGMVDLVFQEFEMPRLEEPWRVALERRMRSVREVLLRHPWSLGILESRKAAGPSTLAQHDAVLACLRGAGFSVALAGHAFAVLDSFVFGFVLTEITLPFHGEEETHAVATEMVDGFSPGAYPHLAELAREVVLQPGYAFSNEFSFGLELILDALERSLAAEQRASRRAPAAAMGRRRPR